MEENAGEKSNRGDNSAEAEDPEEDVPPLSQDSIFDALSSRRGRYVLECLRRNQGPVGLDELVDSVAAWETGKAIDMVSSEHRERVLTSLCHTQLPELTMMGMVQYDEEEGLVKRGPQAEKADAYLRIAAERDEQLFERE